MQRGTMAGLFMLKSIEKFVSPVKIELDVKPTARHVVLKRWVT